MADTYAMSGNTPNYSGMLFNKGNTKTPFSTMIGARRKSTNHTEFVTGQEFETAQGSQPDISESKSLTAPDSSIVTREQKTNVTQIFQESVAGQQPNPPTEEDFQIAAKMAKIAQDIEYTFINGVYQKSTGDSVANRSRGLLNAITSNAIDADGKPLSFLLLCEALKLIDDSNGSLDGLILGLDATSRMQLNADAAANGLTIVNAGRVVNGIAIDTVLTPLGTVGIRRLARALRNRSLARLVLIMGRSGMLRRLQDCLQTCRRTVILLVRYIRFLHLILPTNRLLES